MKILSFQEALADSLSCTKRHLLLGNGFSIACFKDIFHYQSLFDEADFSKYPELKMVFEVLNTQDFECAIKALESGAKLLPIYTKTNANNAELMLQHAAILKELLITTIANNHPSNPNVVEESKLWSCRKFLNNFIGEDSKKSGYVFTLNYDLLLYWAVMNDGSPFDQEPVKLNRNDGFGDDEDEPDADYVVWQGEKAAHSANIHFLHGALHLFDSGSELQKYTWARGGVPLIDQARSAIEGDKYPLFVSEGTSEQKKNKIRHNAYLYQGYKTLTANAQTGTHCFFIFGHSLDDNDDHILMRLARGKFKKLYVGIHGSPESIGNKKIIAKAKKLVTQRNAKTPLALDFFDSESARVWG